MATISIKGFEGWIEKLDQATERSKGICKMAVWEGGKVVGDSIKASLERIPVQDHYVPEGTIRTGILKEEKDKIISAFGLSKMRADISVSTKAGFKPGTKISAVENGTSYMQKHPVVRQAVNRARKSAQSAMEEKFLEETKKIFE